MKCIFCRQSAARLEPDGEWPKGWAVNCQYCGSYVLDESFAQLLLEGSISLSDTDRDRLCVLVRGIAEMSGRPARLDRRRMDELLSEARRRRSPVDIADDVLLRLSEVLPRLDDRVTIYDVDCPKFGIRRMNELKTYLAYLEEKELTSSNRQNSNRIDSLFLTLDGWGRVDALRRGGAGSRQAFVAMWFGDEMQTAYANAIAPAVVSAGFEPLKVDLVEHNDDIVDRIIAGIRGSAFLIADFTDHRHGVYYEAGYARGLGLPVINCCHARDFEKLHFDVEHTNCIKWETPEQLFEKLLNRIRATIVGATQGQPATG